MVKCPKLNSHKVTLYVAGPSQEGPYYYVQWMEGIFVFVERWSMYAGVVELHLNVSTIFLSKFVLPTDLTSIRGQSVTSQKCHSLVCSHHSFSQGSITRRRPKFYKKFSLKDLVTFKRVKLGTGHSYPEIYSILQTWNQTTHVWVYSHNSAF